MNNRNNPSPSRSMQIKDSRKLLDEGKGLITMSVSTAQARSIIEKTWSSDSQKIKNIREENNDIPNSTFQSLGVKERKRRNDIMTGIQRAVKDTQTGLPALFGTGFGEQQLKQIYQSKELTTDLKKMYKAGLEAALRLNPRNREISKAISALGDF